MSRSALVVAGARPNFMKVAPIMSALRDAAWRGVLVHTGQHFDASMSDAFFADLDMAPPKHHLGVGAGTHAEQTARVMERFDAVLVQESPDWVVVVGDVNSTLAAALVTAKRRPELGCRLAHVEAGLRSGDWRMPEEVNRVVTDQVADLLLTHSPEAAQHLAVEGVPAERVRFVGNVMIDSLLATLRRFPGDAPWEAFGVRQREYGLVTLHRPSNVDVAEQLELLLQGLELVAEKLPLLWPVHPRARARLDALRLPDRLTLMEPASYREMVHLLNGSAAVITDSGGLQEESSALGVPCVTLREATERPITVTHGTNRLVSWPPTPEGIAASVASALETERDSRRAAEIPGWDGCAAVRVVEAMASAPLGAARCRLEDADLQRA